MKKLIPVFLLAAGLLMTSTSGAAAGNLEGPQAPLGTSSQKFQLHPKLLAAARSAGDWLRLIDSDHYPESWEDMAAYFKLAVKQDVWVGRVTKLRQPLGEESSRTFRGANFLAPGFSSNANSIAVQFQTTFSKGGTKMEVVNLVWDSGMWRVSGYYIR